MPRRRGATWTSLGGEFHSWSAINEACPLSWLRSQLVFSNLNWNNNERVWYLGNKAAFPRIGGSRSDGGGFVYLYARSVQTLSTMRHWLVCALPVTILSWLLMWPSWVYMPSFFHMHPLLLLILCTDLAFPQMLLPTAPELILLSSPFCFYPGSAATSFQEWLLRGALCLSFFREFLHHWWNQQSSNL